MTKKGFTLFELERGNADPDQAIHGFNHRRKGFTLIELLVVISIIAILVGILLPVLGAARQSAQQLQCLANVRSLAQATATHNVDNKGVFPMPDTGLRLVSANGDFRQAAPTAQTENWFVKLDNYLGLVTKKDTGQGVGQLRDFQEFKQDPVYNTFPDSLEEATDSQTIREWNRTIKMNRHFRRDGSNQFTVNGLSATQIGRFENQFTSERQVRTPDNTVAFGDGIAFDLNGASRFSTSSRFSIEPDRRMGLRHDGGANVSFVDGHAELVKQKSSLFTDSTASGPAEKATLQWSAEYTAFADPSRQNTRNPEQELIWDFVRDGAR
ncbi:MAG: prepilin-type N-terminal cleavage/methylation domain-containing protein [Planctomycetota bacterium]